MVQKVPPSTSKPEVDPSSKNVTRSDSATCFIVPASLQINLSAAARVVDVALVLPSIISYQDLLILTDWVLWLNQSQIELVIQSNLFKKIG